MSVTFLTDEDRALIDQKIDKLTEEVKVNVSYNAATSNLSVTSSRLFYDEVTGDLRI